VRKENYQHTKRNGDIWRPGGRLNQ